MLETGPFALRTEKMSGLKGVATSCAIEGPVLNVGKFRTIVVKELRLNTTPEPADAEGSQAYYWHNYSGNGRTLVVRSMDRPSGHFVQVKLLNMVENGTR